MSEGLRERKVRMSRRRMEKAAVDLAYENGIRSVTVDQVCAAAGVSRSTFFNYFPSLEYAIFGAPLDYDPELTQRVLAGHGEELTGVVVEAQLHTPTLVRPTARSRAVFRTPGRR